MKNIPKITKILNHLLFEEGIRPTELSRRTGVPQPTMHRMVTGTIARPHLASVEPLAKYFKLTAEQLLGKEPIPGLNIHKLDQLPGYAQIPLLVWQQLPQWSASQRETMIAEGNHPKITSTYTMIYTDAKVKRLAFAVYLEDDSMLPQFLPQTLLVIDPDREVTENSFVLLKQGDGQVVFRSIVIKNGARFVVALNPQFATKAPEPIHYNDEILGVLVQIRRDY